MDVKSLTKVVGKELALWQAEYLHFVPVLLVVMMEGDTEQGGMIEEDCGGDSAGLGWSLPV